MNHTSTAEHERNNHEPEEFSEVSAETVDLFETDLQWAAQMSQTVTDSQAQWQAFLRGLAIAGVHQWLNSGATISNVSYNRTQVPSKGVNLSAGDYRLCALAVGGITETTVPLTLTDNDSLAHLYILTEVREEANQVCIVAGLRQDEFVQWCQDMEITASGAEKQQSTTESTIQIPLSAFSTPPNQMLLYLSCLKPSAIEAVKKIAGGTAAQPSLFATLESAAIDAGQWLQGKLDTLSEQLSWALLPPMPVASAMRSAEASVEAVMSVLFDIGVQLPAQSRGISGSFNVGAFTCRIYAWVWPVSELHAADTDWSLFLLIGPSPRSILPADIRFQVSDLATVLVDETLAQTSESTYFYTQLQGNQEESFTVQVTLPTGESITLPKFSYRLR